MGILYEPLMVRTSVPEMGVAPKGGIGRKGGIGGKMFPVGVSVTNVAGVELNVIGVNVDAGQLEPAGPPTVGVQVDVLDAILSGRETVGLFVVERPVDVACNCHPCTVPRVSVTVTPKLKLLGPTAIGTNWTMALSAVNESVPLCPRGPVVTATSQLVLLPAGPPKTVVVVLHGVVDATATVLFRANVPITIMPTTSKVVPSCRMLLFKILIAKPFLCLHIVLITHA